MSPTVKTADNVSLEITEVQQIRALLLFVRG